MCLKLNVSLSVYPPTLHRPHGTYTFLSGFTQTRGRVLGAAAPLSPGINANELQTMNPAMDT